VVAKILYIIDTEIISRAENITEFYTESPEDENGTPSTDTPVVAPSPSDMLERLNQSLGQPTTFTPAKRVDALPIVSTKSTEQTVATTPEKGGIDPYREIPKE
jgi:hypothetical protein